MRSKTKSFSNFSQAKLTTSQCFRPDNEKQIEAIFTHTSNQGILARGHGLSYGDCCLNDQGVLVDTSRLNHLLSFDENSGLLVCQGNATFADLLLVNPNYIPPVIPGTLQASVAGGVANDVHGKNNHRAGTFGQHIEWLELQLGTHSWHCDRQTNADLYYATIAGLGLTGIIRQLAIKMRKASPFVSVRYEKFLEFEPVFYRMQNGGCQFDYQVAWLDLLNEPHAILSLANHEEQANKSPIANCSPYSIPKLPVRFIHPWVMKQFNRYYFNHYTCTERILSLAQFNNPLDSVLHWNRLYGKQGLLQFQAVVNAEQAFSVFTELLTIIRTQQATPTLAVLKYFTQPGPGLLSFAQPGFTLAIDFINNKQAKNAILAMNKLITEAEGKIYLAKDFFLTAAQFSHQYPKHKQFIQLLTQYNSPMCSDLSKRLGITS